MNHVFGFFFLILAAFLAFIARAIKDPQLTRIKLDAGNRMLRFGFGKHNGNWFVRVDLWFVAFRIS